MSDNITPLDSDVCNVTFDKKEYAIVGDAVFAQSVVGVPGWMRELVGDLVATTNSNTYNAMSGFNLNLYNAMLALQVAENQYTQVINSKITDQEAFIQAVETLNSTVQNAEAEIVGIKQTYATKDFALATAAQTLEASLNGGAINSSLGQLASTMTNQYGTIAQRMDVLESTFEDQELKVEGYANATDTLETYVGLTEGVPDGTGLLAKLEILQKQNDGIIETTTGTYDVILRAAEPAFSELVTTAEPYASWLAAEVNGGIDVRLSHIGDVYIKYQDTASGAKEYVGSYKFIRTTVDNDDIPSTDAAGFTWAIIQDQAAEMAYTAALNAHDLADGKRRVFVELGATSTPVPPYDSGDLWLIDAARVVNDYSCKVGDILRCVETKGKIGVYEQNDWVLASSYATAIDAQNQQFQNFVKNDYAVFVTNIQSQVDKKSETFYQNSLPTGRIKSINVPDNVTLNTYVGDLWKNTYVGTISGYLGNNTEYIYTKTANGSNWNYDWVKMEVPDIVFDTIDTKKSIYSGNSVPVAVYPDVIEVNDMWITGSSPTAGYDKESVYIWNGDSWTKPLKYTDDSKVIALRNGLANGTVTLNLSTATVDGSVSLSSYIAAEIDKEVVVYSGSDHTTQTGMKSNDIYIEKTTAKSSSGITIDVVNTWKYKDSAWVQIGNNSNLTALADLTDGKRTIYSGTSLPINSTLNPLKPNDLFIPTSTFVANTITYTANEMYRYNGVSWEKATRYDEIKSLLQTQIDNKIETTYGGATPPYANRTNVAKDPRGGDYWYCDTDGAYLKGNVYKYTETANGSKFNYTWTLSSDVSKSAFDLADKKRIIFGNAGNSVPTLEEGLALADIWIPSSDGSIYLSGKVYKCTNLNPIAFVEVDYTNDEVVNGIINGTTPLDPNTITIGNVNTTFLEYITAEIDGKVGVYSGETAPVKGQPSGVAINDIYLWFTTASKVLANGTTQVYDITRTYKYSGTVWNEITTDSNIVSLADLADGKRTIFSGNTVPIGSVERDIWIPSADVSITTSAMCSVANGTWNGTSCSVSKYYQGEVYQFSATGKWIVATKYTANLEAVRTNLQGQLDGKVETYYQATVPTGMTALNNGDYWYCTADVSTYKKGKVYKYVHATTSWVETADVSRYAFDVADGKAAVFSSTSLPTSGYKINDMLIVVGSFNNGTTTFADGVVLSSNATRTSGFTPADWVKKINDTEDLDAFVGGIYTPAVASLQNQIDGQISYYFFDSSLGQSAASVSGSSSWTTDALKKEHNGDIAYDTKLELGYWYDRSVSNWVRITGAQNAGVIEALKKAAEAKEAADNVIVSYYAWKQTTEPATKYKWLKDDNTLWKYVNNAWAAVDVKKGDTLTAYDNTTKDTTLYVHNGSVWTRITPNGIVANAKAVTDLNTNLSSLGTTVSGHTSLLNTVDSRIGDEGARVESKFAYDSTLTLNGITYNSGFGLATSLTSGSGIPVGSSEFWINADKFKLTTTGYSGVKYSPFSVNGTDGTITFNGKVSFSNVTGYTAPAIPTPQNLISNSSFAGTVNPWYLGWNPNEAQITSFGVTTAIHTPKHVVPGINGLTLRQVGRLGTTNNYSIAVDVIQELPCSEGVFYEISAYVAAHRCQMTVGLAFYNSADTHLGESPLPWYTVDNGGNTLEGYTRVSTTHQAPTGAVKMHAIIRKRDTDNGYTDSWIWALRPQVVRVGNLTGPVVPYTGSSEFVLPTEVANAINTNTTTIDGGKITTGSIRAGAIAAGAITADKLAANSITTNNIAAGAVGSINIASTLQSDNYVAGSSGWRLSKVAGILSEFNSNVAFRGSVDVNNLTGAVLKPHIVGEQVISTYGEPSYIYHFNHPTEGITGRSMVVIVLATASSEWYSYDGVYNQGVKIYLYVNETDVGTGIGMGAYNTTAAAIGVSLPLPVGNFSVRISLHNAGHDSLKRNFNLAALSYLV